MNIREKSQEIFLSFRTLPSKKKICLSNFWCINDLLSFQELTPLIFCFELPNVGTLQTFPELTSPFVLEVQERYNVQVMFRTRAKLHSTLVMVKGCDWEVIQVKAATIHLINHMCGAFAVSTLIIIAFFCTYF